MNHRERHWMVRRVRSSEHLVDELHRVSHPTNAGFLLEPYLWFNDSDSVDSQQEYALINREQSLQIDTVPIHGRQQSLLQFIERLMLNRNLICCPTSVEAMTTILDG